MELSKIMAYGINYSNYRAMYGRIIQSKILDIIIAMDYVYGEDIDRDFALLISRKPEQRSKMEASSKLLLPTEDYNITVTAFMELLSLKDETRSDHLSFIKLMCRNGSVGCALYEIYLHELLTIDECINLLNKIRELSSTQRLTILREVMLHGNSTLSYFNMGLSKEEFSNVMQALKEVHTISKKQLDELCVWHLVDLLNEPLK